MAMSYHSSKLIGMNYFDAEDYQSNSEFFEDAVDELIVIEQEMSEEYELTGDEKENHRQLVSMFNSGQLDDESELVWEWRQAYMIYLDWLNKGSKDVF